MSYEGQNRDWKEPLAKINDGIEFALVDECFAIQPKGFSNDTSKIVVPFFVSKFVSHVQILAPISDHCS